MRTGTAACGLRYAVRATGRAVGHCALSIRCGSRDEGTFPEGIAHFTEHTLFRGTETRSAREINSCLDHLGGELNAFTTKEEIVLHATVLAEDTWKAAALLMDLAVHPVFPDKEITTERGVVADEILACKDSPADDIYDRFEELLFAGHPLSRSILGTTAALRKIQPETLRDFVQERFHPTEMVLSIVSGDGSEEAMEGRISQLAAQFFPETPARKGYARHLSAPAEIRFEKTVDKRHHEANAVLGCTAPSLKDGRERYAAALLANLLGGPAGNSLLNARLRERYGWCYGVECTYTPYADSGVFAISLGCDKENLEKCLVHTGKVLERLRTRPLSERGLRAAKRQLLGQLAIAAENGETQCLSLGKSLLNDGTVPSDGETRRRIEALTPEDLLQAAGRLCDPARLSKLVYL